MIKATIKKLICGMLAMLSLSQCMTIAERNVTINTRQIESKLNQKITSPLVIMKVFQLQLSNAMVVLHQTEGRIHAVMDTQLTGPLISQAVMGKLEISGKLELNAVQNAIVLDSPAIESIEWQGLAAEYTDILNQVAKSIGKKWLNSMIIYQARPEDLTYAGKHYKPSRLVMTGDGVQVTLVPSAD